MITMRLENIGMNANSFSVLSSVVSRKLLERGCAMGDSGMKISIVLTDKMKDDEYHVAAEADQVKIATGGTSGAFAGMGAYLTNCKFDGYGGFVPYEGELALKPENPIHGMYFASHFQNFYEAAPIIENQKIIEDLALRGCNALMLWYDMHQFADVDTPESVAMIARLKAFFQHASAVGMKTVFGTLANESFCTSEPAIRAEWTVQNGYFALPRGHYHVEICPNKEQGMEEILDQRRRVMAAFSDVRLDYISIWPYDQGGCTCSKCTPWGANGFLKTMNALHELYSEILPDAKILCSTWYFDHFIHGEWDAFKEAINAGGYEYIEYLFGYFANDEHVPEYIRQGNMPAGKRMVAFPEISMYGATPWGGFGANPMPERMESNFRENGKLYCGALPYSEGIFEDINKSMMLAFYSGRTDRAEQVLREYAQFELCLQGGLVDDFVRLVYDLEQTLNREPTDSEGRPIDLTDFPNYRYEELRFAICNPEKALEAERLASKIDASLPEGIRTGWRWRIIRLRASIDRELCANNMHFSAEFEKCMGELRKIYHADKAYYVVAPLTRQAVCDGLGGTI